MLKENIKTLLQNTKGQFHTVKEIADALNYNLQHETGPGIRNAIRDLLEEGCPIGSCSLGYYWITNKAQLEDYLSTLQSRCDAIHERISMVMKAYAGERNARHMNPDLPMRERCRCYVVYLAEEANIPYQAVWALAYRRFTKMTGVDTVKMPDWYNGSVLNYIHNKGLSEVLFKALRELERVVM